MFIHEVCMKIIEYKVVSVAPDQRILSYYENIALNEETLTILKVGIEDSLLMKFNKIRAVKTRLILFC